MPTTEEQIKQNVVDELAWDGRVRATDVYVTIDDGHVILSGTVPTHLARRAALSSAQAVPGVKGVRDELAVGAPEVTVPTDTEIRKMVESTLSWHPDIEIDNLAVIVRNGVVQLEGAIGAYWLKAYAEDVVLGLAGVASVKNELTIVPTQHWADEGIADEIMAALRRRSLVEPSDVAVEVDSGRVTLSGRVRSSTARQVVQELVTCTRGVREVENNLVVDA